MYTINFLVLTMNIGMQPLYECWKKSSGILNMEHVTYLEIFFLYSSMNSWRNYKL